MKQSEAIDLIINELMRAESKHPVWPKDIVYQGSIISEEIGEMIQAINDYKMENKERCSDIINECIQVGAMAIRFLKNFER